MCVTDLVLAFADDMLPLLDEGGAQQPGNSLLSQLLLKATSKDKQFVVDEATRALTIISQQVLLRPQLCPPSKGSVFSSCNLMIPCFMFQTGC